MKNQIFNDILKLSQINFSEELFQLFFKKYQTIQLNFFNF